MDTRNTFSIAEALHSPQAKGVLDSGIELRFARGGGKIIRKGLIRNKKQMPLASRMNALVLERFSPSSSSSRSAHGQKG